MSCIHDALDIHALAVDMEADSNGSRIASGGARTTDSRGWRSRVAIRSDVYHTFICSRVKALLAWCRQSSVTLATLQARDPKAAVQSVGRVASMIKYAILIAAIVIAPCIPCRSLFAQYLVDEPQIEKETSTNSGDKDAPAARISRLLCPRTRGQSFLLRWFLLGLRR